MSYFSMLMILSVASAAPPIPTAEDMLSRTPGEFFQEHEEELNRREEALRRSERSDPTVDELTARRLTEGMSVQPFDMTPVGRELELRAQAEADYAANKAAREASWQAWIGDWRTGLLALLCAALGIVGGWGFLRRTRPRQ